MRSMLGLFSSDGAKEARPWLKHYPDCVPHHLEYPDVPVWDLLRRTAGETPQRTACHYYAQQLSYAELWAASKQTASALRSLGLQPGQRVGILLPNIPEYMSVLNGIWLAGGTAVSFSPLMVAEEIAGLIRATDCRLVVGLDLLAPLLNGAEGELDHTLLISINDRLPHWQRLGYAFARLRKLGFWQTDEASSQSWLQDRLAESDADFQPLEPDSLDQPAFILPTGGTTGSPKAVVLSHRNLVANAWQLYHWAGRDGGTESVLAVLPFFHSFGLTCCLLTGTALSASLILHHRFIPRVTARMIDQYQPTIFPAVPKMVSALNDIFRKRPPRQAALKFCISGGAPLNRKVAEEFASHTGATVVEGYGLSEASPVTHAGPLDGTHRPGTIGLPLPDTEARIVDAETGQQILERGEVGELIVRGPQIMSGYWNDPVATRQALRDGWLHTGDLATCDEDGFFRIVDRKKDLIITSGFNVYPGDVEYVLRQYPGVLDVAVVGIPDEARGQLVKAVVAVKNDQPFNRRAFNKFCREHLAKHKRPQVVEVVQGDLPRNFLGKVLRRRLREQHGQGESAAQPAEATT